MISKLFFGSALIIADRVEVAVGERLGGLRVVGQELGRAAEGVHHHRVVERGGDDLAGLGLGAHRREVRLVGHRGVDAVGAGDHRVGGRPAARG